MIRWFDYDIDDEFADDNDDGPDFWGVFSNHDLPWFETCTFQDE